jgi:hypothetical protein
MDPALESPLKECKGDQGLQRKVQTWPKAGGIFPMYLKHCIPLRLYDEQMVERDASILHRRVENRKKIYGWTGQQPSSGFINLAPSILHYNWF